MLPNHDYVQGTAPFLLDTRSITPIQSLRAAEAFLTNGSIEDDVNNRVHEKFVWILSHSHIKHQCQEGALGQYNITLIYIAHCLGFGWALGPSKNSLDKSKEGYII